MPGGQSAGKADILTLMNLTPSDIYPSGGGRAPFQLLDVRAPVEVAGGALPGAVALPLLDDEERHLVGLRYAEGGRAAATALGHRLFEPHRLGRVRAWRAAVDGDARPTAVACWRGGERSRLVVEFIDRPNVRQVIGGYRALRAHLMGALAPAVERKNLVVLSGLTGAGKTRLLRLLRDGSGGDLQAVDLEGLARHRGSAFGHVAEPQPSQQTFENALAAELVLGAARRLVVEDESRYVGKRTVPDPLYEAMQVAPLVVLETGLGARATAIYREYVVGATAAAGCEAVAEDLQASIRHLKRRLGGALTEKLTLRVAELATTDAEWADEGAHVDWIATLLREHYDPLYRRSLDRLARPVVFAGDEEAVVAWLTEQR